MMTLGNIAPSCGDEDGAMPFRSAGAAVSVCPRHIRGAVASSPRRAYTNLEETQFETAEDFCVPTRTNHLRCWGLDSHLQNFIPGLWKSDYTTSDAKSARARYLSLSHSLSLSLALSLALSINI